MKVVRYIIIEVNELRDILHYDLICSQMNGSLFQRTDIQRKYKERFNEEERKLAEAIEKKASRWYLRELPVAAVKISEGEYNMWIKLKHFLIDNCTIYGRSKR